MSEGPTAMTFVKVATLSEVPAGTVRQVDAAGRAIALVNAGGQLYALDNTCLHRGGPLGQGFLEGESVECPWHGWQFDVRTGRCTFNPSAAVPTYEVRVEGDDVLVAVPPAGAEP